MEKHIDCIIPHYVVDMLAEKRLKVLENDTKANLEKDSQLKLIIPILRITVISVTIYRYKNIMDSQKPL